MVGSTPLPLYPSGKSHRYLFDRRLGWPQSRSGRRGKEKILDPTGTVVQPAASRFSDYAVPGSAVPLSSETDLW
jgi:hypothetical protein